MNNSFWTVLAFTFKNKFKSKSFIVTSIVLAVILTVLINLPYIINYFSSDEVKRIGAWDDGSPLTESLDSYFSQLDEAGLDIILLPEQSENEQQAYIEQQVKNDEVSGFVTWQESVDEGSFPELVYLSEGTPSMQTLTLLRSALNPLKAEQTAQQLGLTLQQVQQISQPATIATVQILDEANDEKTGAEKIMAYGLVYALLILIFMAVTMYGNLIATEITAEKSSRVMEILVSSVTPLRQMFGKICGVFLLGILQISVYIFIAFINLILPHNIELISEFDLSLSDIDAMLLVYFILFYLLGFFLYATVFAALGSIVSRTEDLGQAIMPVTFMTLAGFYIGIFGINSPDAAFVTAASYFPFFTPFIMFLRIGLGDPAGWEIAISFVILLVTIFVMGWLAAKIYRTGVLLYGKRPSFKELKKAMKAYSSQQN